MGEGHGCGPATRVLGGGGVAGACGAAAAGVRDGAAVPDSAGAAPRRPPRRHDDPERGTHTHTHARTSARTHTRTHARTHAAARPRRADGACGPCARAHTHTLTNKHGHGHMGHTQTHTHTFYTHVKCRGKAGRGAGGAASQITSGQSTLGPIDVLSPFGRYRARPPPGVPPPGLSRSIYVSIHLSPAHPPLPSVTHPPLKHTWRQISSHSPLSPARQQADGTAVCVERGGGLLSGAKEGGEEGRR